MKKPSSILIAAVAIAFTAAAIPAQSAPKDLPKASPSASPAQSPAATATASSRLAPFHGIISGVDGAAKTFTLTSKSGNARTFEIASDTKIMNGESAASFSDLKVGAAVGGSATKVADGKYKVSKVILGEKEKAEASASASPSAIPGTGMKKSKK